MSDSCNECIFTFFRILHTDCPIVFWNLQADQHPFPTISTAFVITLLILAILSGARCNLKVVLICILTAKVVQCFLRYFYNFIYFIKNSLLVSIAHFLKFTYSLDSSLWVLPLSLGCFFCYREDFYFYEVLLVNFWPNYWSTVVFISWE